ncbi:unnamed protein product [Fraxinus pennsylvanica]|uniref:Uncharacterized protein n=1 Tax=Fraxinus pennsylvanica TaxID=56036 RepID=A0AAD2A322_9LAMI|nr:unnamed protein product [Fraxinus pennsylvanica]
MIFCRPFLPTVSAIILVLLNLLFLQYINAASIPTNETDKLAMWAGVTCGQKHDSITNSDLKGKKLGGTIGLQIRNFSFLYRLDLSNNYFRGGIPPELGSLRRLQILSSSNDLLQGQVPARLSRCSNLVSIVLGKSSVIGKIPTEIGSLQKLLKLNLRSNNLTRTTPASIGNLTSLQWNHTALQVLVLLDLKNNNLSGTTDSIMDISSLVGFKASCNSFTDLSGNNLSGKIPRYLANVSTLIQLNLSFNNLEGELPVKGVFSNLSAIDITRNPKVCGGILQLNLPKCKVQGAQNAHWKQAISLKLVMKSPNLSSHSMQFYPEISYDEFLKATGGFSSENLKGSDAFATVFKGTLGSDESIVVVKLLSL